MAEYGSEKTPTTTTVAFFFLPACTTDQLDPFTTIGLWTRW